MTGISIVALIVSIVSAGISLYSLFQKKMDSFQSIASLIFDQKSRYLEAYEKHHEHHDSDEHAKYLLDETAVDYCNAFEHACMLYINNAINRKLFRQVFRDEIRSIVEGEGVASFLDYPILDSTGHCYEGIRCVYNEWKTDW